MKKAVSQFRIDDVETLAWLGQITMSYMLAAFAELRAGCSLVRALVSQYLAPMQIEEGTQGGARTAFSPVSQQFSRTLPVFEAQPGLNS